MGTGGGDACKSGVSRRLHKPASELHTKLHNSCDALRPGYLAGGSSDEQGEVGTTRNQVTSSVRTKRRIAIDRLVIR